LILLQVQHLLRSVYARPANDNTARVNVVSSLSRCHGDTDKAVDILVKERFLTNIWVEEKQRETPPVPGVDTEVIETGSSGQRGMEVEMYRSSDRHLGEDITRLLKNRDEDFEVFYFPFLYCNKSDFVLCLFLEFS